MANPELAAALLQAASSINPYSRDRFGNLAGALGNGLATYQQGNEQKQLQQDVSGLQGPDRYRKLAEYWAARDPDKAQKYLALAQQTDTAKSNEQFGQTVEYGGKIYQLRKSGAPIELGEASPKAPKVVGGYLVGDESQLGNPVPLTPQEKTQQQRADASDARSSAQLSLAQAAAARAEQAANFQRQQAEESARRKVEDDAINPNRIKYKNAVSKLDTGIDLSNRLTKLVRDSNQFDLANPRSKVNAEATSLATQLQDIYRAPEFADLGVVNPADVPRIDAVVPNPTSPRSLIAGKESVITRLGEFNAKMVAAKKNYQPIGAGQSGAASPAPGIRKRYNPATGRIE